MDARAKELARKGVPWSRDARWWIVAAEAVVLIGIGLFMLIDTGSAGEVVLQLIGVVLLAASLALALSSIRNSEAGPGFYDAFRAGIGVTAGTIATASWWSDYIANHAVRVILGCTLVAWSLLSIVGLVIVRGRGNVRLSTVVVLGLSLALGIVLLTGDDATSEGRVRLLGAILLVFGLLLAALAYYLYSRDHPRTRPGMGSAASS